jgi:putative transposase
MSTEATQEYVQAILTRYLSALKKAKRLILNEFCQYGRYGYRRVTALLRNEGWRVNHKRVERLWRQEALKVPRRQPKRRRLWLNNGSCIRLRPLFPNHVWSYDFVVERTTDGKPIRMLNITDEYTRECLAIHIGRQMKAADVLYELSELFVLRDAPDYVRSDNGSEFTAEMVRGWLGRLGVKTLFIEPGGAHGRTGTSNHSTAG